MLRVIVQLVPGGDVSRTRELARAEISRMGDDDTTDYRIAASEGANTIAQRAPWSSQGMIVRHYSRQSVWALVAVATKWAAAEAEKH